MTASQTTSTRITDSHVVIERDQLDDLAARLRAIRLPRVSGGVPENGVPLDTIRSLVERWRDDFEWTAIEARINRFPQVVIETVDATRMHAVHLRGAGDALPVVLLHGWADTFYSQLAVAERLVEAGHDVVVPSLPGFAFSDHAPGPATSEAAATAVHELMTALGYRRYAVHGGDWGGAVAHTLMTNHTESVAAAHLTDIPYYLHFSVGRDELEQHERDFLDAAEARQEQPQYYRLQAERPLTLAYGMADSPVALLAWLTGLYTAWTDQQPDAETVLAQVSLYWFTNSFHSSVRFYSEGISAWDESGAWDGSGAWDETSAGDGDSAADETQWSSGPLAIPTALAIHPADIAVPTRAYAERFFAVERFTVMPSGGHFAAMDAPGPLADDIAAFLKGRS